MLPREPELDPLQAQDLSVPPREAFPVRRLRRLCMCLSSMSPLLCLPLEANLNPFLSPSIREYRECSSQASPHPLHNARESPSRRDQLNSRLSDLQRCRGSSFGDQKASSIRLSPVFRFDRSRGPLRNPLASQSQP